MDRFAHSQLRHVTIRAETFACFLSWFNQSGGQFGNPGEQTRTNSSLMTEPSRKELVLIVERSLQNGWSETGPQDKLTQKLVVT